MSKRVADLVVDTLQASDKEKASPTGQCSVRID